MLCWQVNVSLQLKNHVLEQYLLRTHLHWSYIVSIVWLCPYIKGTEPTNLIWWNCLQKVGKLVFLYDITSCRTIHVLLKDRFLYIQIMQEEFCWHCSQNLGNTYTNKYVYRILILYQLNTQQLVGTLIRVLYHTTPTYLTQLSKFYNQVPLSVLSVSAHHYTLWFGSPINILVRNCLLFSTLSYGHCGAHKRRVEI